jgi:hypothetical protein
MTRTSAKWVTMALVLILAAGAQAERKRDGDRKRSDRRSTANRPNERERNEREERMEPKERMERERDERDERNHDKPELRIFRLENAPAESIIDVIYHLAKNNRFKDILSNIPIAFHEHSNAIIVIAPPRALEMFKKLVYGLDKPSDFHKRISAQQRQPRGCCGNCPKSKTACGGKCGGRCPKCRTNANAKGRKPSGCSGKCAGKCPKCRAGAKGNPGAKSKKGPGIAPVKPMPKPQAAPGGCGGCKSRRKPGAVMSKQGNCKNSDF